MPDVFQFLPLDPPRPHGIARSGPLQGLQVGLFVHTDHPDPLFPPLPGPFIAFQHLGRPLDSRIVPPGRLPVSPPMRLQRRLSQNPTEARPDGLSGRHLLQSPDRPVGPFQSVLLRSCTSQVFPARPLQGGNPARPPGPGGVVHGFYPPRLIAATYPPDGGSMLPDLPTYLLDPLPPVDFQQNPGPPGDPLFRLPPPDQGLQLGDVFRS
jgi:hypothetical protein